MEFAIIFAFFTPLHIACYRRNVEIVKLLLDHPKVNIELCDAKGISSFLLSNKTPRDLTNSDVIIQLFDARK